MHMYVYTVCLDIGPSRLQCMLCLGLRKTGEVRLGLALRDD